ncbi:reverse transcriptase domain-containing protein [Tanacetum coccineum]
MEFTYALRFEFTATNNEAEYEALIAGLRIAARMGVRNLEANRPLIDFTIPAVPKVTTNKRIALSKTASTSFATNQTGVGRNLEEPIHHVDGDIYWIKSRSYVDDPYIEFHKAKGTLLHERNDAPNEIPARAEIRTSKWCPLSRSFLQPWLRSSCMHSGPRSVVARALRSGYYWPTMHRDARDMIKKCNDCQVHRPIPRQPQQELTPITSPWPFHKWGIDIAGPFPVAAGGLKFLIVAIDYFTKWIEAKAVATITGNQGQPLFFSLSMGRKPYYQPEIGMPTIRTAEVNIATNDDERRIDLDILEERREQAAIREEKAKKAGTKVEGTLRGYEALGKGVIQAA